MKKKIQPLDIIILLIFFIAICFIIYFQFLSGKENSNRNLLIITEKGEYSYSLNQKKTVQIKGDNGITLIEINNGKFRFKESCCLNKNCVKTGWISISNYPVICLPNRVTAYIIDKKNNDYDVITK